MQLEKAIKIIETYIDDPLITNKYDFIEALKLGIEAVEGIIAWRVDFDDNLLISLPGETDD